MLKKTSAVFYIAGFLVLGIAGAGIFFLLNGNLHSNNSAFSSITGLKPGDLVRVEAAAGHDYIVLNEAVVQNGTPLSIKPFADERLGDQYHLMVSITPKGQNSVTDISFLVNKKTGQVRAAAQGLPLGSQGSLFIDDKKVEDRIAADWGGQMSLSATSKTLQKSNAKVCLDIGGYRGGNLSVCHDVSSKGIEKTALTSFAAYLASNYVAAMMMMTEQFSAIMIEQTEIIGMFLDAKHQLETQRLFQQLQARAHKDYHPSEEMCTIGTIVRDLAQTEGHVKLAKVALNEKSRSRELASGINATYLARKSDMLGRLDTFREHHCTPMDNVNGLLLLCDNGGGPAQDRNMDIDYTRMVELPLTINIDLGDPEVSDAERNVFSLLNNIFMPRANSYLPPAQTPSEKLVFPYQDLRSITAMRGIARNSFSNIIAQKVIGPGHDESAGPYLKALMMEFGLPEDEVTALIGENPSYFAQMEILTKKMYQHPNFFINLYTRPANVDRMQAAMKAIKLMQDRDIYNALLRREMLMSMLLEIDVRKEQNRVSTTINKINIGDQGPEHK